MRVKLEKKLIHEISENIRGSLENEIRQEITARIKNELNQANEKELTQMRRKLKMSSQTKKDKLVSQHENEFTVRVNQ